VGGRFGAVFHIKFREIASSAGRVEAQYFYAGGWTDGHTPTWWCS